MSASSEGFKTQDNKTSSQVPAGTTIYNPSTGQTGNADGYGGVNIFKPR